MIINSLLDTDLYTFSVMNVALHQFSTTNVEYTFKCRNKAKFTEAMIVDINTEVDHFCTLQFTEDELNYLSSIRFFKPDFIDFLRLYKPNRKHINISAGKNNVPEITVKGSWYLTVMFEVPVLAIVNEVYFRHITANGGMEKIYNSGVKRLEEKYEAISKTGFQFSDFGTRRRLSHNWQEEVIIKLKNLPNFTGTSNVYFAKKYDLVPIGTMSHQMIQVGAGQNDVPLIKSQQKMLQSWVDEYRGDLGIALSDTYGVDAFLRDFDLYFAKLYDGVRHDSGDPLEWADKIITHYEDMGIDPMTKTLVFSDGLTVDKATEIWTMLDGRAKIAFGIGTHLTNDFKGLTPLQIVMKITTCNGRPVAKVSDSPGKGMCHDDHYLTYLKDVFKIKE